MIGNKLADKTFHTMVIFFHCLLMHLRSNLNMMPGLKVIMGPKEVIVYYIINYYNHRRIAIYHHREQIEKI